MDSDSNICWACTLDVLVQYWVGTNKSVISRQHGYAGHVQVPGYNSLFILFLI